MFTFSHSKTAISFNILLVLQILCLRNTFIFRSEIASAYIYIICISLYPLWYDAIYKRQYIDKTVTLRKCMYMRASELRFFWHFHILKLLFPSIFWLVLQILCLRNIFNFRCQITSPYTVYNQRSFLLLLMVGAINDSIPKNTNI